MAKSKSTNTLPPCAVVANRVEEQNTAAGTGPSREGEIAFDRAKAIIELLHTNAVDGGALDQDTLENSLATVLDLLGQCEATWVRP